MKTHNGFPHPVGVVCAARPYLVSRSLTRDATAEAAAAFLDRERRHEQLLPPSRHGFCRVFYSLFPSGEHCEPSLSPPPPRAAVPRGPTQKNAHSPCLPRVVSPSAVADAFTTFPRVRALPSVRVSRSAVSRPVPCVVRRRACALAVARFRAFPAGQDDTLFSPTAGVFFRRRVRSAYDRSRYRISLGTPHR